MRVIPFGTQTLHHLSRQLILKQTQYFANALWYHVSDSSEESYMLEILKVNSSAGLYISTGQSNRA